MSDSYDLAQELMNRQFAETRVSGGDLDGLVSHNMADISSGVPLGIITGEAQYTVRVRQAVANIERYDLLSLNQQPELVSVGRLFLDTRGFRYTYSQRIAIRDLLGTENWNVGHMLDVEMYDRVVDDGTKTMCAIQLALEHPFWTSEEPDLYTYLKLVAEKYRVCDDHIYSRIISMPARFRGMSSLNSD